MSSTSPAISQEKKGVPLSTRLRRIVSAQEFGIFLVLVVMGLFLTLQTDNFLTSRNLFNVSRAFSSSRPTILTNPPAFKRATTFIAACIAGGGFNEPVTTGGRASVGVNSRS